MGSVLTHLPCSASHFVVGMTAAGESAAEAVAVTGTEGAAAVVPISLSAYTCNNVSQTKCHVVSDLVAIPSPFIATSHSACLASSYGSTKKAVCASALMPFLLHQISKSCSARSSHLIPFLYNICSRMSNIHSSSADT